MRFMSIFYITILYNAENIFEIHKLIYISILKVLVGVIPKKRRMKPKYVVCSCVLRLSRFHILVLYNTYYQILISLVFI